MDQNFQSLKIPTAASTAPSSNGVSWANPSRITTDDGSSATLAFLTGGDFGATIVGESFDFQQLPSSAVIDGIEVNIDGSQTGCYGDIDLNITGAASKSIGALNGSYGGSSDLWGLDSIDPADIASLEVTVIAGDVSGGDGVASMDYMSVTVFWHIEVQGLPSDVPTRFAYKVYSREGRFLGELPKVTSKFGFPQDINSAGSAITITCGEFVKNEVTVTPLLTEAGDPITTEDDEPIYATATEILVAPGGSPDEAIFKNSNRIKVWMYNQYYPNGKLMFSGQVNRVGFKYGGDYTVKLLVYSDSLDLNNFIARGYPFSYTTDVSQTTNNLYAIAHNFAEDGWEYYGQSWVTGPAVTNIGAISILIRGTADVTLSLYDGPNGNLLGSVSKTVSYGSPTVDQFEFPQLIPASPSTTYFFAISLGPRQDLSIYYNNPSVYSSGSMYGSAYSGGSGGGIWDAQVGDLYFVTKHGLPTTTTTFTSDDPITDMVSNALLDYNARGGSITERDFEATGLSLTYTFVVATIYTVITKAIELSPTGFYSYIDLGTAEIDIKQVSSIPDFTVTRGRHVYELNLELSIEQVKNYLLLSGGDIGGGVNLFRDYSDPVSASNYGLRTSTKSDNRITLNATADAIGDSLLDETSDEIQETVLTVLNEHIDITLLTPGKTIGFRNFGNFIDDMVLQIVRREPNFSDGVVPLVLGRLPIRATDQIQDMMRGLENEQTINNPSAPT